MIYEAKFDCDLDVDIVLRHGILPERTLVDSRLVALSILWSRRWRE